MREYLSTFDNSNKPNNFTETTISKSGKNNDTSNRLLEVNATKMADLFGVIEYNPVVNFTEETIPTVNSIPKTINYLKKIMQTTDMTKLKIDWPKYLHEFYLNNLIFDEDANKIINRSMISILSNREVSDNDIEENLINSDEKSSEASEASEANESDENAQINEKLNHLNRFMHLNALFELLNELNVSHDQIKNYQNYTLAVCQDYYLCQILKAKNYSLLKHWFAGVFNGINLELYDGKHKTRYQRAILVLKKYLSTRPDKYSNFDKHNKNVSRFISAYSSWSSEYLSDKFNQNKMTLNEVFAKLNNISKTNELFIELSDRSIYLNQTITNLVPCWEKYLQKVLAEDLMIDEKIISAYNSVNLYGSNFNNINIKFCELWQSMIKNKICPENYGDSELFESLKKVCPMISSFRYGQNKSNLIIQYFSDIYKFESNLIGYILTGLNVLIKNIYSSYYNSLGSEQKINNPNLTSDIINTLVLISLYENKEFMWNQYFKQVDCRIKEQNKRYPLSNTMINFEIDLFNQLVGYDCQPYSEKTKTLLNNIKNSMDHMNMIKKCKINYVNKENEQKTETKGWNAPDLSKVDYVVIDKHIVDSIDQNTDTDQSYKYCLIDSTKYPSDINAYLAVGRTYYEIVSETKKIEWNVENSIINFNIGEQNVIATILQYTIISTIISQKMTKEVLINYLCNSSLDEKKQTDAKKYLESIINNMLQKDLIRNGTDYLYIDINSVNNQTTSAKSKSSKSKKTINISCFVPTLKSESNIEETDTTDSDTKPDDNKQSNLTDLETPESKLLSDCNMKPECVHYLRSIMMYKMFKEKSSKVITMEELPKSFEKYLDKYIKANKFAKPLNKLIRSLPKVSDGVFIKDLEYLSKRDVIEKKDNGYSYVM
jgi:hypothetical protein